MASSGCLEPTGHAESASDGSVTFRSHFGGVELRSPCSLTEGISNRSFAGFIVITRVAAVHFGRPYRIGERNGSPKDEGIPRIPAGHREPLPMAWPGASLARAKGFRRTAVF